MTATPIKNRLPDVFRLAWWATGARREAHTRFPHPDGSAAREEFANEFICERSIDRKLEAMIQEKGDAVELVLDGHLLSEHSSEVNLAELLDIARKEFAEGDTIFTVDEKELEREWPPLWSELNAVVCR